MNKYKSLIFKTNKKNKTMKKTLCLSVRLASLVSISEKAYKARSFDGSEIAKNLGMEAEEIIRLKQQLGIAHAFKNVEYSDSWEIK